MSPKQQSDVTLRNAAPEDATACGQICYDAFSVINQAHGFPPDFPAPEAAIGLLSMMFSSPDFYSVVVEHQGRVVGSNCLYERSQVSVWVRLLLIRQRKIWGFGRMLMNAVMDRAKQQGAAGIRLVQAAFHNRSLSLYAGLGFDIREPLACMQGRTRERSIAGCAVRPAQTGDLEGCNALARQGHGFDRSAELAHAIARGTARVVERGGRVTGYATDLTFFSHATAETNTDLQALIASAEAFGGPGILVPERNSALFRWCLANGLRVVQPMTLMSVGLYSEPAGAWLPSILF